MDELARRRALKAAQEQKPQRLAVITSTPEGIILNAENVLLDPESARAVAGVLLDAANDYD